MPPTPIECVAQWRTLSEEILAAIQEWRLQHPKATLQAIDRPADPAPGAVGDFLLAQITFEKGADAGTDAQITPVGWTLVRRTNAVNQVTGTDIGQAIFYRLPGDSEPVSYGFPFNQAVKAAGGIIRYTGVNLIFEGDADKSIIAHSGNTGESNPLTALSVNALERAMLVALFGVKKTTTLSIPTGMEGRYIFQNPQDVTIRAADDILMAADLGMGGATGNRTSTAGSVDKWAAQLVALRAK